jgi:uroporphyrinogen decarboxylase
MCQTGCDNISIDENIDLAYIRDLATDAGKSFGGNLKLTQALLLGGPEDAERDTIRCLDVGKDVDGFILAPGCDLAYDTPEQNLRAVASMVHDEYHREVVRRKMGVAGQDSFEDVEVPDYGSMDQVIIDVVTLNSSTCAPCQYMMAAARKAAEVAGCPVHVQEHKITNRNGLGYMAKLGVSAIPTICIQGKPLYSSIIPDRDTLIESIQSAWRGLQK